MFAYGDNYFGAEESGLLLLLTDTTQERKRGTEK